jgi:exosortase
VALEDNVTSLTIGQPAGQPDSADSPDRSGDDGITQAGWVQIAVIATLMILLFWPNLRRLWDKTNPFYGEPNWGHAICVPVIGLYYLYLHRQTLRASAVRTSWSGLVVCIAGILFFGYGIWPGQNDFAKDLGMVICLFGVVLLLCGWELMRVAWFPIVFLICALPWPSLIYSRVAEPLQGLAASVAVDVLRFTGVQALNSGTKILMEHGESVRTLNVAEACAGMRSLMTFVSIAAAVAFLSARPLWQKLLIVVSAVPIAIFCNVMRVAGQGLLDHYVSTGWSDGFAHSFAGVVMLIPALFLILLVAYILDNLFIEAVDDKDALRNQLRRRPGAVSGSPQQDVAAAPSAPATLPPRPRLGLQSQSHSPFSGGKRP